MQSKWFDIKTRALQMRIDGKSIREVERSLGIPRSTLSGWFKNIILTEEQRKILESNRINSLVEARKMALIWHHKQKEKRLQKADKDAFRTLSKVNTSNLYTRELCLSMLYLGEGLKTKSGTGLGNSNPMILKFFMRMLIDQYNIDIKKIKCSLHIRADQDPNKLQRYWAEDLGIPIENFTAFSIDKRTEGRNTYPSYRGVCVIHCGNISLQRKLLSLSRQFCEKINQD